MPSETKMDLKVVWPPDPSKPWAPLQLGSAGAICCGLNVLGGFPFGGPEVSDWNRQAFEALDKQLKGIKLLCNMAVVTSAQLPAKQMLIDNGFIEVAQFDSNHGASTQIFILLKGNNVKKVIKEKTTLGAKLKKLKESL